MIKLLTTEETEPPIQSAIKYLSSANRLLDDFHSFKAGQIVRWKRGLKNRKQPEYDQPAIVRMVLNPPIIDLFDGNTGSMYYREPLSLLIGTIDEYGDFFELHVDGRRFEPYPKIALH